MNLETFQKTNVTNRNCDIGKHELVNNMIFFQKRFDSFLEKLNEDQKRLFTSSTQLFLVLAVSMFLNKKKTRGETFSAIFTFLGGPYLMSSLTEQPIESFKRSLVPFTPQFIVQDNNKKIFDYQKKYDNLKKTFPESVHKKLEYILKQLNISRKLLLTDSSCDRRDEQECITKTLKFLDFLFFFFEKKENDKIDHKIMISKLDFIVNNYGKDVSRELRTKVFKPIIGSMLIEDSFKKLPINPVYLHGSHGVGKTRFVGQLAKILDIPIVHYENNEKKDEYNEKYSPKYIYGREFDEKNLHPFTKLLYKMKTNKKKFGIFFIDELDKYFSDGDNTLNIFLLKLLNPDKTSVEDPYLQMDVSTKNILFVCTGNKKLTEISKELASLESRFVKIRFPSIPDKLKLDIAIDNAKIFFDRNLSDKEIQDIKKLVFSDRDEDTGKPREGVRQLVMDVQFYFRETQNKKIFEDTDWSSD